MLLQNSNAIETGGYTIQKSLRFRQSASAYLNRTPSSAGNRKTWTWSAWVKKAPIQGTATSTLSLFSCTTGNTDSTFLRFGFFQDKFYVGNWNAFFLQSTPVYRDPSAWYHVVVSTDTTQGTASNRMRVYINGTEITAWSTDQRSTYLTSSVDLGINQATQHSVGSSLPNVGEYFDGYLAEINFIDGQALTPSSFGQTDVLTGVWTAKKYTGTYGTNGFYLPFTDTSSTTNLTKDSSGNNNNWTPNNISLTAGVTYDSMIDSPSLASSAAQPVGNYCTLNPLKADATVTRANSYVSHTTTNATLGAVGTMAAGGKVYMECSLETNFTTNQTAPTFGFTKSTNSIGVAGNIANSFGVRPAGGTSEWAFGVNGTYIGMTGITGCTTGDIAMIAFDPATGKVWAGKNGVWYNSGDPAAGTNPTGTATVYDDYLPYASAYYYPGPIYGYMNTNFGQRPFAYTPPTGFKALCTTNLD